MRGIRPEKERREEKIPLSTATSSRPLSTMRTEEQDGFSSAWSGSRKNGERRQRKKKAIFIFVMIWRKGEIEEAL
jgi:hypothetical protein